MLTPTDIIVLAPAPDDDTIVDPQAWFDSPGPLELEIGCGKGGFLLSRALANPDIRLLGIEWANKYFKYCADRMARRNLTNVRVMRTDAQLFVQSNLPTASVTALHVYHPDPWPKKRHHKRRLFQPAFVEAVTRVLIPGGTWMVQSDHQEYFGEIRELLDACRALRTIPWDEADPPKDAQWKGTNFEIKYAREGRPIYRVAYQLIGPVAGSEAMTDTSEPAHR